MIIKMNIKASDVFYNYFFLFPYILIGAGIGSLIYVLQTSYFSIVNIIIPLIIILLIFICILCFYIYAIKQKGVLGEHTIEIAPDYFREATAYNDDKYEWNTIKKINKTKRDIIIHCSLKKGFIIPFRDFSNIEEYNKFYDLAVSYYNQAKKTAS